MTELARLEPGPHPGVTRTIAIPAAPTAFAFGGGRAALGYPDGRLRVVDLGTGATLIDVWSHGASVGAVALSGRWLVAAVGDRIEVWDTLTATRLGVHPPHPEPIVTLAIEPGRKWVASIDRASPGVRVAELRTGVEVAVIGRIAARPTGVGPVPEGTERALRTALAAFSAFRIMHADCGAADDEVEHALHELVQHAWNQGGPFSRRGAAGWGLVGLGAEVAAVRLDGAAELIDAAIRAIAPHERASMHAVVQLEAWRVDLDATPDDLGCHSVGWLADGRLVVEHDEGVGVWDVLVPERVAELGGTLLGVEGDHVLVVDPYADEVRSWQPATGDHGGPRTPSGIRSCPLPAGRLVPSFGVSDEVVLVDDATVTIVRFGRAAPGELAPPQADIERVPAGIGRLGTLIARVGDDLIAASRATLRICPWSALAVDDARAGLPIHALAVHPEGAFVAVIRVLDDHEDMRVERWFVPEAPMRALPGGVSLADSLGVGPSGRTWASGATVRIWDAEGAEVQLEPGFRSARVHGRWACSGNRRLDLDSGLVAPAPLINSDERLAVGVEHLFVASPTGLVVLDPGSLAVVARIEWDERPVRTALPLRADVVVVLFLDGGVSAWSAETGLVEPWELAPAVDVAVTHDG
ncbi:MAG: hypothetical protein ABMA64_37935, partial [Myxococcota bacterium]